jgi:hypothetical protein
LRATILEGPLQANFKATGIRSLYWRGDELVDWVGVAARLHVMERNEARDFTMLIASMPRRRRRMAILRRSTPGTKGLLLHDGKILRELDPSFNYAQAYE